MVAESKDLFEEICSQKSWRNCPIECQTCGYSYGW